MIDFHPRGERYERFSWPFSGYCHRWVGRNSNPLGWSEHTVEAYRRYGVGEAADRALPKKRTAKGLSQGQMTESFVLLSALGGECIEDIEILRQDKGLEAMLGYNIPVPETARQWLDKFHDEELMSEQLQQRAFIPVGSAPLAGLREPNRQVIWSYIDKVKPKHEVTRDIDAHLVETAKANAFYCYDGYKAFQPIEVEWAETGLVLAEEFRQGNVLAGKDIKRVVDEAGTEAAAATAVIMKLTGMSEEPVAVTVYIPNTGYQDRCYIVYRSSDESVN